MIFTLKVTDVSMIYGKRKPFVSIQKKNYSDKPALDHVSFTLTNGFYGLLGPNGSGKSTLMNVITGILQPSKGTVEFFMDNKLCDGDEFRRQLGFMPQQQGLYDQFTGRKFLEYICLLKNISKQDIDAEIKKTADYVNMTHVLHHKINTYSGGMKQRILLAAALLNTPGLLVLDEPTAGLDPKERAYLRKRLADLSKNAVILMSTHVVSDIEDSCDGVLMLKNGKLVCEKNNKDILKAYNADNLEQVYMKVYGESVAEVIPDRNV